MAYKKSKSKGYVMHHVKVNIATSNKILATLLVELYMQRASHYSNFI